jgi:hypothetical protein
MNFLYSYETNRAYHYMYCQDGLQDLHVEVVKSSMDCRSRSEIDREGRAKIDAWLKHRARDWDIALKGLIKEGA